VELVKCFAMALIYSPEDIFVLLYLIARGIYYEIRAAQIFQKYIIRLNVLGARWIK
jgi:hypothetical protein